MATPHQIIRAWLLQLLLWAAFQCHLVDGFSVRSQQAPRISRPLSEVKWRREPSRHSALYLAATNNNIHHDEDQIKKRSSSALSLPFKVGGFYIALGLLAVKNVRQQRLLPKEAMAGCGLLWLGFVLAISFMEAWVKFRAPFLPRHYGLDVGRTVFPVLNAVEVALCGTLWLICYTTRTKVFSSLACATAILLSQVFYFTPQLVLLGKYVIAEAFPTADASWSPKQVEIYEELCAEVKSKSRPSPKLHIVYVVQEILKVSLIGRLVWSCRSLV